MATTTNFSVRMDGDIKKQCEALYGELGINLTTAINVFLRQSLRVGGFPFDVRLDQPNKETIAAMLEAERIARDPSVINDKGEEVPLRKLSSGETLTEKNRDHALTGNWSGHRECHIQPDWLLVYRIEDDVLVLTLARTGTHSDLFGK